MEVNLRRAFFMISLFGIVLVMYLGQCGDFTNINSCLGFAAISVTERPRATTLVARSASGIPRKRRFPDAIIIGAKKAGTRALLRFLSMHPNVSTCGPEVHYFDRHVDKGLEWYRQQMPLANKYQVVIEKTPRYFVTKEAPRLIYELNRNMKLILLLRDPVQRALSDFTQGQSKKLSSSITRQRKTFKDVVLTKDLKNVKRSSSLVSVGMYVRHLKNWYSKFAHEQILLIDGQAFIENPGKELRRVERFLDVSEYVNEASFVYSKNKSFYCPKTDNVVKCLNGDKGRKHIKPEPFVLDLLYDFFEPYNKRLYTLTGIDFGWRRKAEKSQ